MPGKNLAKSITVATAISVSALALAACATPAFAQATAGATNAAAMQNMALPPIAHKGAPVAASHAAHHAHKLAKRRPHKKVDGEEVAHKVVHHDPLGIGDNTQTAWADPMANKGMNQINPGYTRFEYMPDKVIPLTLREAMNTTIRFPATETIDDVYVSDPVSFEAIIPRPNVVLVRVKVPGADGNITAMGSSGNLYQFYVKGEPSETKRITDVSVDVMVTARSAAKLANLNVAGEQRGASASDLKVEADWLRSIGFRPENIVHDLAIYVPKNETPGVAPERVFRDGQYTYIDYGANADAINEWPVASLVVQGVETPVNARTAGPNGRMLVVEAIGNIALRNGNKLICIRQNGNKLHDPLKPAGNVPLNPQATTQVPASLRSPSDGRRFAVDLGSGAPASMALQWKTTIAAHPAEFAGTAPHFPDALKDHNGITPLNAKQGDVKLRVGPFYNVNAAINACKVVGEAGGGCTVINEKPDN